MIISRCFVTARILGLSGRHNRRNSCSQSEGACLVVSPAHSLLDTPCTITGKKLTPGSTVTLTTNLKNDEERFDFISINRFKVNKSGSFDTSSEPPLDGGSYDGIHPMGPFWSMQPSEDGRTRMWPYDITAPLNYHLTLSDHNDNVLTSAKVHKTYMAEGVERIEVREGRIRGTLFLPPPHQRPSPAIITVYGGINRGKVVEDRSAILASYGFVSLALAYFGVDDLPKIYNDLDIEYFEEAVDLLARHPDVDSEGGVGVYGASLGGNIAISMAACLGTKVKAVVAAGSPFVSGVGCNVRYRGELLTEPTAPEDYNWTSDPPYIYNEGLIQEALDDYSKHIKFSHASADLLAIQGDEDVAMASKTFAKECIERAKIEGKANCWMAMFPGLGHILDLPYSPVCLAQGNAHPLLPPGTLIYYGGHRQQHALAQMEAWQTTLQFFRNAMFTNR